MNRIVTLSTVIVGILLIGLFAYINTKENPMSGDLQTEKVNTAENTAALTFLDHRFKQAEKREFRISVKNEGQFDFSDMIGSDDSQNFNQQVQSTFTGIMNQMVMSQEKGKTQLLVTFENMTFNLLLNGNPHGDLEGQVMGEMASGALVDVNEDGNILEIHTSKGMSDLGRDIVYSVIKSFQFVIPKGSHQDGWEVVEKDLTGIFAAFYDLGAEDQGLITIEKSRGDFTKLFFDIRSNFRGQQVRAVPSGKLDIRYHLSSQQMVSVSGQDRLQYFDERARSVGFNKQDIELETIAYSTLSSTKLKEYRLFAKNLSKSAIDFDQATAIADRNRQEKIHRLELKDDRFEDVMALFSELDPSDETKRRDQLTTIFLKLRAYVYLNPDQLDVIGREMAELNVSDPQFTMLMDVLVNSGSAQAQQVLVSLMDEGDQTKLESMIPAVGFVSEPTEGLENSLRQLMAHDNPDISSSAKLSVGVLASQLKNDTSSDPQVRQRFQQIEDETLRKIEDAETPEQITDLLRVVGNFGSEKGMAMIIRLLGHEDKNVRKQAVLALRFVENERAYRIVGDFLAQEKDVEVKESAATSLAWMKTSSEKLHMEIKLIAASKDASVKMELMKSLMRGSYLDKAMVTQTFESLAAQDSEKSVRDFALSLLSELRFES